MNATSAADRPGAETSGANGPVLRAARSAALFIAMAAVLLPGLSSTASACWMEMKASLEEGVVPAPGDTVTVLFTLTLTHGNCLVEIAETEFSAEGAKIVGATKWKRVKERPVVVEKRLRVAVIGDGTGGDVSVRALRICERMGGDLTFVLVPAVVEDSPGKEE